MVNKCNLIYNFARCLRPCKTLNWIESVDAELQMGFFPLTRCVNNKVQAAQISAQEEEWTCHWVCPSFGYISNVHALQIFGAKNQKPALTAHSAGKRQKEFEMCHQLMIPSNCSFFSCSRNYFNISFSFRFSFLRSALFGQTNCAQCIFHFIQHTNACSFFSCNIATANVFLMRTSAAAAATAITSIYSFESKCRSFCRWFIASAARVHWIRLVFGVMWVRALGQYIQQINK